MAGRTVGEAAPGRIVVQAVFESAGDDVLAVARSADANPREARSLCAVRSYSQNRYGVTTEVYPDAAGVTADECDRAQVACVTGGLAALLA